ncbi:hypothetical protein V8C42DRAFT_320787 [Trichoderma barbatum]
MVSVRPLRGECERANALQGPPDPPPLGHQDTRPEQKQAASTQSLPAHSSPPHDLKTFPWSTGYCFLLLLIHETRELGQRMLTGAASCVAFVANDLLQPPCWLPQTRTGDFAFCSISAVDPRRKYSLQRTCVYSLTRTSTRTKGGE